MLKLRQPKNFREHPYACHYLLNVIIAIFFSYYIWQGVRQLMKIGFILLYFSILLRSTSITVVFLCRRRSVLTSKNLKEWLAGIFGSFVAYFYTLTNVRPISMALAPAAYFLTAGTALLGGIAVLNLGRSFGIVPANRGIKTKGLYALVRHPIYSLYILYDIGFLMQCAYVRNFLVFLVFVIASYLRAKYEERILRQDPVYETYAAKTHYMFIPGVL